MQILLSVELAAPPEAVWPHLTDPERMSAWSEAPVRGVAWGDEGRLDRIGALREVEAPGPTGTVRLLEVIAEAEPPQRLVYRVVRGPKLVRAHRGEQTLERTETGCRLTWRVTIELEAGLAEPIVRASLEPALRRSLDALAQRVSGAKGTACPSARSLPAHELPLLEDAARAILEVQRTLADTLRSEDDPKWAFARVYALVTEEQLAHLPSVRHPEWVLRLVPRFHHYYFRSLERWRTGRRFEVEAPWAASFSASDRGELGKGLVLGMVAHIEEDLPRALADVHLAHFRGRCDFARFRADYLGMGDVFSRAGDRLLAELPAGAVPGWLRAARAVLPDALRDALTSARTYDVARARSAAFERGLRLAAWRANDDDSPPGS